jgi:hypothetical protein
MASSRYLITVSALALAAASPAIADGSLNRTGAPAVSAPNGKAAVRGGGQDGDGSFYGDLAYTVPLGHSFGLQVDGVFGYFGETDDGVARGAAHLFWRDPGIGLLGVYGSATTVDSGEFFQIGAEAQAYLGRLSLEGKLGAEEADLDDGSFWTATAAYYPGDNLRVWGGARYSNFRDDNKLGFSQTGVRGPGHVGVIGVEYQTKWTDDRRGISLFGEGRWGENDYSAVWAGARFYFGPNKSLIRRHREDDPATDIPDLTEFTNPPAPPPTIPPPQPK